MGNWKPRKLLLTKIKRDMEKEKRHQSLSVRGFFAFFFNRADPRTRHCCGSMTSQAPKHCMHIHPRSLLVESLMIRDQLQGLTGSYAHNVPLSTRVTRILVFALTSRMQVAKNVAPNSSAKVCEPHVTEGTCHGVAGRYFLPMGTRILRNLEI